MLRVYDMEEIKKCWEENTKFGWDGSHVEQVASLIEESRWEMEKGRTDKILTVEEAIEILVEGMLEEFIEENYRVDRAIPSQIEELIAEIHQAIYDNPLVEESKEHDQLRTVVWKLWEKDNDPSEWGM